MVNPFAKSTIKPLAISSPITTTVLIPFLVVGFLVPIVVIVLVTVDKALLVVFMIFKSLLKNMGETNISYTI